MMIAVLRGMSVIATGRSSPNAARIICETNRRCYVSIRQSAGPIATDFLSREAKNKFTPYADFVIVRADGAADGF